MLNKTIQIRLDEELLDFVKDQSKRHRKSISAYFRDLVMIAEMEDKSFKLASAMKKRLEENPKLDIITALKEEQDKIYENNND